MIIDGIDKFSNIRIPRRLFGKRLDVVLSKILTSFSRSCIKVHLRSGNILVNGLIKKPSYNILGDENISFFKENNNVEKLSTVAIKKYVILHEDEHIIIVNKPPGLVVHPGSGNLNNTMIDLLLLDFPNLENVPRYGIVHRLDKDYSISGNIF